MSDARQHERAGELFRRAQRLPAGQRAAFLDEACAGDAALRREVEALLAEGQRTGSLQTADVQQRVAEAARAAAAPECPASIGRYRIVRLIGEGGMGAVYEAEQLDPRRRVALKVIRPGLAGSSLLHRFRLEAQVLGQLHHPGIAQVYEAGTMDQGEGGQPFFAMELVTGRPLLEYAGSRGLGTRQRLELIARVCDALHHAHQKGVIHRDLKPANILVEDPGDGVGAAEDDSRSTGKSRHDGGELPRQVQPKILDFGVARATDADLQTVTLQTDVGQLVGTVPYMSPEQAAGDPAGIDIRCDVYALGVIVYELLTGRLPYALEGKLIHEAVRVIREETPTPISSYDRVLRGDVETIVGKALEKDKARRYQSATALADDIRRYLEDEPIVARPPSTWYQVRKFARRNRALVTGAVAVFVALSAGAAASTIFALQEQAQRRLAQANLVRAREAEAQARAEAARAEAKTATAQRVTDFMVELFEVADRSAYRGNTITAREVLDQGARRIELELEEEPRVRSALMNTMGRVYQRLGIYEESKRLLEEALRLRRRHLGDEHETVARSLFDLGELYHYQKDYEAAEAHYREALAIQREVLGPDHAEVARTIDLLGRCHRDQGDFAGAERLHREAMEMRRRLFGEEHEDITESLQSLGMLAVIQGRLDEAEEYFREALDMRSRLLGREHAEIPELLYGIGVVKNYQDDLDEAERWLREALAMSRKLFGDDHPNVGHCLSRLGIVLNDGGEYEAAEAAYREALETYRRVVGEESVEVALVLHDMGTLARDRENYEEAERLLRRALALREKLEGPDHPYIANTLLNLGAVLMRMQDYEAGETVLLRAYRLSEPNLGSEHFRTVRIVETLAELYDAWGEPDEAAGWRTKLPAPEGDGAPPQDG